MRNSNQRTEFPAALRKLFLDSLSCWVVKEWKSLECANGLRSAETQDRCLYWNLSKNLPVKFDIVSFDMEVFQSICGSLRFARLAPSDIVYNWNGEKPAIPVAFGYTRPRKGQGEILVSKVKLALLPHSGEYDYAQSLLKDTSDTLKLGSPQQITEDFLKFAIEHATKECGGQPTKGWVVSVPQSYEIDEVQSFRAMIQRAGGLGDIYIHGESDCVTYAHLTSIEENIRLVKKETFRKRQDLTVAVGIIDLGAGTADVTTSEICFKIDGSAPTINELRAPLGFTIGGDLFDDRFIEVLRAKLGIQLSTEAEKAIFEPFTDYFHKRSKPQWSLLNYDEEE
ncbi:hypothetical protein HYALB_00005108 [Hymenoscyphus albidus]|uniref:Uncharacterized protein n=1 Tax=Hymenoscyphus albidus TaxID=595503 RepID=A0A9N9LUZ9_9HELO|nr:hypothetical protein HYALB_00005108 [Hymenoscyphus albidus]